MAKARPETIILKGDPIMSEAEAHEAITPGSLIRRDADGQVSNQVTGTNDEAPATFAKENDIGGDDLTHPYAVGEVVQFFTAYPGMVVQARLVASVATTIGLGLVAGPDGTLKLVASSQKPVAVALETITSVASVQRIKVEIV